MTPPYIEACKRAKEEGWLTWEPQQGDWWLTDNGTPVLLYMPEKNERYAGPATSFRYAARGYGADSTACYAPIEYIKTRWTWLPTVEQLIEMLGPGAIIIQRLEGGTQVITHPPGTHIIEVKKAPDFPLALLKAVEAVRRSYDTRVDSSQQRMAELKRADLKEPAWRSCD